MEVEVLLDKQVRMIACGAHHVACTVVHGWVPDEEAKDCMACNKNFTTIRRRVSHAVSSLSLVRFLLILIAKDLFSPSVSLCPCLPFMQHHCRKCGGVFCGACSAKRFPLLEQGYSDPVRVCERCYTVLTKNNSS